MSCEYECYCDDCHQMQTWTSDEHDGNSCPSCGKQWIRPLPLPEQWLVDDIARHMAGIERDAHVINAIFVAVGCVVFIIFILGAIGICA